MQVIWGMWNKIHITKHGGSVAIAEALLSVNDATMVPVSLTLASITATISGRSWTLIVGREPAGDDMTISVYPITLYPTGRGGRKHRRWSPP